MKLKDTKRYQIIPLRVNIKSESYSAITKPIIICIVNPGFVRWII